MMASIAKRPDGRWRARYRDPTGREHARHFARKVDGQRWLDEVTASIVTGRYVDPKAGRITFRAYAEEYRRQQPHRPATRDRIERTLRKHVYPAFGDVPIGNIRPTMVQGWVSAAANTLAPTTLRITFGYVMAIFAGAVRDRVIATSPCTGVRLPEAHHEQADPLSLETVLALETALPPHLRAVVPLVAGSGLRQGEVFGLEIPHVDFLRSRSLRVAQQLLTAPGEPPFLAPPKTAKSHRVIPLAGVTLDRLAAHLAAFPAHEVEIEDRTDPRAPRRRSAQLVFTHQDGRPVARHDWAHIWSQAARSVRLPPRIGLHQVRHFYASLLIRYGESVKTVQERLGHSSPAITLNTYVHLWPDSGDRTREAVSAGLGSPSADSGRTVEPTR
jgi:integrase